MLFDLVQRNDSTGNAKRLSGRPYIVVVVVVCRELNKRQVN